MMTKRMKKLAIQVAAMLSKIIMEQQTILRKATCNRKTMNSLKKTHQWKSTLPKPFLKKFRANTTKCNSSVKSFKRINLWHKSTLTKWSVSKRNCIKRWEMLKRRRTRFARCIRIHLNKTLKLSTTSRPLSKKKSPKSTPVSNKIKVITNPSNSWAQTALGRPVSNSNKVPNSRKHLLRRWQHKTIIWIKKWAMLLSQATRAWTVVKLQHLQYWITAVARTHSWLMLFNLSESSTSMQRSVISQPMNLSRSYCAATR